jgi:hypothetical protein
LSFSQLKIGNIIVLGGLTNAANRVVHIWFARMV